MSNRDTPLLKFGIFAAVMVVLSACLIIVFGEYRSGSTNEYSAVFADSSALREGDTVRVSGVVVGSVRGVELEQDHRVRVEFDADRALPLTTGTQVAVRYLNLVGDRYLELVDKPGNELPAGGELPIENTVGALDLDLLLGGLKPVIQGLNARDVNALTWSLLEIVQGKEGTVNSILGRTASFSAALADNNQIIAQLIDNLKTVMTTLQSEGGQFSNLVDRLEQLITQLSNDRDPIAAAIDSLESGTATVADLLTQGRPPLAGAIDQVNQLAANIDGDKQTLDTALRKAPENFRKLVRTGAYGNFIQYYLCDLTLRVNDLSGQVVEIPAAVQTDGRCAP
ncbi:MCE family protein [Nocardia jinanensis]|uniref:Mammalian cell entry protein n=1 Tax=Nocardia jinanensis TaxID=382504 RepID=A0A917RPN3_9NOCA|nr:MCE family protein [Nocardia jinanensis]GGL17928.1 mammalian cell entry protein [Nocardia jinanensis]